MSGWLDIEGYRRAWQRHGDGDPYFTPEFLRASAIGAQAEPAGFVHGGVLYPFLVRPLPGGRCDLTSGYGFGGPSAAGEWRGAFRDACAERGVVSEFVRFHPVRANQRFAGDDVKVTRVQDMVVLDVQAGDEELVQRMLPQARNKLRKAVRAGLRVKESRDFDRFSILYTAAMRHLDADESYLFGPEYFQALDDLGASLTMLDAGEAAALFLSGAGAMHYFLAASTDDGRRHAATNLIISEAMRRARDAGLQALNLGGGLREGDSLHDFKASFGPGRAPYYVGTAVHDEAAYRELCADAETEPADGFFPAYRRPAETPA
ncbi:MAG TPA: GNAT family N-acetyltransferase [Gaiellales bacterium]|nr:GNAT family N-acetyltransferase [Gaiellales bacterium]